MDSRHNVLLGRRVGDTFHCYDGEVLQADVNAARNILARKNDSEIQLWTSYQEVKSILLERTERFKARAIARAKVGWDCSTRTPVTTVSNYGDRY